MALIDSTLTPSAGAAARPGAAVARAAASTSRARMRPYGPEGEILARSMPPSAASRRASGVAVLPPGNRARPHADFREHPRGRRRHLHRHLVCLNLEQIVAGLDAVTRRLEPLRDLAFRNGLAELRHQHVHRAFPRCGALFAARRREGDPARGHHVTETYCVSKNSISPSCAPSRPMPDCFIPPKGAAGSETSPRLSPIMPKSSCSDTRMPRVMSLV